MVGLLEEDEHPLLTERGRALLHRMWEHPATPRFSGLVGDRLDAPALARVRALGRRLRHEPPPPPGQPPAWLLAALPRWCAQVPAWREAGLVPPTNAAGFAALPTTERADLAAGAWRFVPDDADLEGLVTLYSGGTGGPPLALPSHPESAAAVLPLLQRILDRAGLGIGWEAEREVAIVHLRLQPFARTGATVSAFLDGAGFAKVNLDPGAWRQPEDRARYLDALDPQIYTGSPIALAALARLPLRRRPRALISSSQPLGAAQRAYLGARLGCPVFDAYGLTESGPIAIEGWLLAPDLYVEVVDPAGRPLPLGARGEVTVSGGRNPYLPLLRYRTGDFGRLVLEDGAPRLVELSSRHPIFFAHADANHTLVNCLAISQRLDPLLAHPWQLQQRPDRSLLLRVQGPLPDPGPIAAALTPLLGPLPLSLEPVPLSLPRPLVRFHRNPAPQPDR